MTLKVLYSENSCSSEVYFSNIALNRFINMLIQVLYGVNIITIFATFKNKSMYL